MSEAAVRPAPASSSVSARELLGYLRRRGRLPELVRQVLAAKLVVEAARAAGLSVSDQELNQASNRYRRARGLFDVEPTRRWLESQGLTDAELEQALEEELLLEKFRQHLADTQADSHFEANKDRFARARLSRLTIATESEARELLQQLRAEEADFAELARQHSLDQLTRASGGVLGPVFRGRLPVALGDSIFSASAGDFVGPAPAARGFVIFLVQELLPAELDADTRALIAEQLFGRWLSDRLGDERLELADVESMS